MPKRNIGLEILNGIREIKAFEAGSGSLRVHIRPIPAPPKPTPPTQNNDPSPK